MLVKKQIMRISIFLMAVFLAGGAMAQTGNFNNLRIYNNLNLKGKVIYQFDNDSSMVVGDSSSLPTTWAVKNFLLNRLGKLVIATGNTFVVSSQSEMLGTSAVIGDVAVRTDSSKSYILRELPASTFSNWVLLLFPANVVSVNGRSGVVTAQAGDYDHTQITGLDSLLAAKALRDSVYTKNNIDNLLSAKLDALLAAATYQPIGQYATGTGTANGTNTGDQDLSGLVPKTTTINGKALSGNVIISASDITTGTLPHAQLPILLQSDIPNLPESMITNLINDLAAKADTGSVKDVTALRAELAAKQDTSYHQSIVGINPVYFEVVNKDSANVRLRMSTDSTFSNASDTSAISSLAVKSGLNGKQTKYIINVKDYGAIGDDITVDTLAFQAAISAARAKKWALFIPSGTYNLPFTSSTELSGIPKVYGDAATLDFQNMTVLNGVKIDSITYPANTTNSVFKLTGTIRLLQSGVTTSVGAIAVTLNSGLNLKAGDILFFTSSESLPYGQNSTYYKGQRAVVDSFDNTTGICYINGQFFYNISNSYVWLNDTVPACDFGAGLTLQAKQNNTISAFYSINSLVNVSGSFNNFGKSGINVTNTYANITARLTNNFRYNNGNSYGITVCDLSDANLLNCTINGSKLCVASGGGDYWNSNQSGGSSGSAAYPANIYINGGSFRPSNIQNQGALDAHSVCHQLNIANATIYSAVYTQAEYTSVQNCDIFYNITPAIQVATKDTTSGYLTIDNVRCYAAGGSVQGGIQLTSGIKSISILNSVINHKAINSTGALMLNFPTQVLKVSNLDVNETGNTDSYIYQYTNNVTIDGIRSSGGTINITPQVDSTILSITNSSFSNTLSNTSAGIGLKIYSGKIINQLSLINCKFLNNAGNGAKIGFNTLNLLVSGCVANNNGKGGLYSAVESSGINATLVKNVTVVNSNLSNTGNQQYGFYHYALSSPSYYNIQNTNFTGNLTANYLIQNGALPGLISSNIDKAGGIISNTLTGSAVLASGTITVAAVVKTGAKILVTRTSPSGTLGFLSIGTIINNTSFVINSSSSTDNSTVNWQIINP